MKDTALLLIDIQESFKAGERWSRRGNPDFEKNISILLDHWRSADLPRFFILHTDSDPGLRMTDPEFRYAAQRSSRRAMASERVRVGMLRSDPVLTVEAIARRCGFSEARQLRRLLHNRPATQR